MFPAKAQRRKGAKKDLISLRLCAFAGNFLFKRKTARHGRHTGRNSQEEPSVMVVAILAAIRLTSTPEMSANTS
jgi:hypothetical protein